MFISCIKKIFVVSLCFLAVSAWSENLLPNSDFGHGLAGYMLGDACDMRVVPHQFEKCKYGTALTFSAASSERVALYLPEVVYQPDTEYEISFMAKSSKAVRLIVSAYVQAGRNIGSAGKYFPDVDTEWKRYKFSFKTENTKKWGGFRIIKNYEKVERNITISIADLYLGPALPKTVTLPKQSASFQWDPLDRRVQPGDHQLSIPVRVTSRQKIEKKLSWSIYAIDNNHKVAEGKFLKNIEPGINDFAINIPVKHLPNGLMKMNADLDGKAFVNNIKFTVCPSIKVKIGELPVDIGINSVFTKASEKSVFDQEIDLLADCGISFIRTWDGGNPFLWRNIEPKDKQFCFKYTDRLVEAANKARLELLVVLGGMFFAYPPKQHNHSHALPDWLYKKSEIVSCPPNMPQFTSIGRKTTLPPMKDWDNLVQTIVRHYKGKVRFYEVMNEPNLCLTEEQYLPYLKNAYNIIKENDPKSRVVGICSTGDYNGHIIGYVDGVLKLGGGKYLDDLSFHAYQSMFEDSRKSAEEVIQAFYSFLKEHKLNDVRLWNTELYYLNPKARGGSDHVNGPRYHAGYLIRRYLLDAVNGIRASTSIPGKHLLEVGIVNENFQWDTLTRFFNNRLLPNDKYVATAVFSKLLVNTKFQKTVELGNQVRAYCFAGENKAVAAVFALFPKDEENRRISFPLCTVLDVLGNPVKNSVEQGCLTIPTSPIPVYICSGNQASLEDTLKKIKIFK